MKRLWITAKISWLLLVGVLLAGMFLQPAAARAWGNEVTLTIINERAKPICFVYISRSTSLELGEDWLGTRETIDRTYAVGHNFGR